MSRGRDTFWDCSRAMKISYCCNPSTVYNDGFSNGGWTINRFLLKSQNGLLQFSIAGLAIFIKDKMCVSNYHFKLNTVVLKRCPGLHITLDSLKKSSLFGTVPPQKSHHKNFNAFSKNQENDIKIPSIITNHIATAISVKITAISHFFKIILQLWNGLTNTVQLFNQLLQRKKSKILI